MSEIKKYQKAMNFKANPRYLRRDFIVPLYTGTEPDIVPDTSVERQEYARGGKSSPNQGFQKGNVYYKQNVGKYKTDVEKLNSLRDYLKSLPKGTSIPLMTMENKFDVSRRTVRNILNREFKGTLKPAGVGAQIANVQKINEEKIRLKEEKISEFKDDYLKDLKIKFQYPSGSPEASKLGVSNKDLAKKYFGDDSVKNIAQVERLNARLTKEYELKYPKGNKSDVFLRRYARREEGKKYLSDLEKDILKRQTTQKKLLNNYFKNNPEEVYNNEKLKSLIDVKLTKEGDLDFTPRYQNKEQYKKLAQSGKIFDDFHISPVRGEKRNIEYPVNKNIGPSKFNSGFIKQVESFFNRTKGNPDYDLKKQKINDFLDSSGYRVEIPGEGYIGAKALPAIDRATGRLPNIEKTLENLNLPKIKPTSEYMSPKKISALEKRQLTQMIGSIGCPTYASGGRVNFSEGSDCYNKGLKALEEGNLTKPQLNVAARAIAESGEESMLLKNILSKAGSGVKFTGLGVKELISVGAGPIGLGVGALLEAGQAVPELAKGDWREAIRSTTLGFLPESIVGSRRTDLLRMAKTDEEKNAAQLLFDYQDKVEEANRIQGQIEALKNPEFTSVEGYESDPGMKIKELEGKLNDLDSFLNLNVKKVNKVTPTIVKLSDRLVESNVSNIIDPATGKPTIFGKIIGTTSVQDKKKLSEDIQKQAYQEEETETETKPFEAPNVVSPDDYINELQQYRSGGRVGFKDGGGPKISRRGFLGFLAGAAAAPFAGKLIKGEKAAQATKVAAKVLPKVADMPEWFPSLVARIEKEGIDISPKATRVEDIRTVKKIEVPVAGEPKPDIIKMTQYPDGTIHIEADVYGGSFDTPFDLHYKPPKSDMDLETGKAINYPGEFSVMETRPRPVYDPHSADWELEYENMSVKDAVSDLERVEKIATGKRIHPKRVEQREKARANVEDNPYDDIINRYGEVDTPDWWDPND
jgi:hypothetical protein